MTPFTAAPPRALLLAALLCIPAAALADDGGGSHSVISNIAICMVMASGLGFLMKLLRQPLILAYITSGVIIGPVGLGLITDHKDIVTISEIGLILLLFMIGLEIDLQKMFAAGRLVILAGLLQFPICAGLAYAAFAGLESLGIHTGGGYARLYCAIAVSLSSTMIVVKLLYDKFELDTLPGRITVGVLVFQDIWAIIVLAIQPNIANPQVTEILKTFGAGALLVTGMFSDSIVATSTRRNDGRGRSGEGKRAGEGGGAGSNMPGFKGELGETFLHPNGDIALGLGVRDELKIDSLRTAGARLIKRLDRAAPVAANLAILDDKAARQWGAEDGARALAEGMALANWRVDFFAGKATKIKPPHAALTLGSAEASFRGGLQSGLARGESVNYARQVAATPPNICNPQWMIAEARRLAKSTGLTLRVIDYAQARKLGMGGLVNVGLGSASKPCLIILEHQPKKISPKARGTRLALVGKTITYDTGGYSLKISNGMKGMKYDKGGGMAVLGAMRHIASSNLPVHVYGVLPCAENMVSDVAYRPDDIITMYNGISVEVTNTDAEGRLVLGDALTYADKDLQATHIVELSTLTGGIVTALGHFCAGVFCNHDKLLGRVEDAADSHSFVIRVVSHFHQGGYAPAAISKRSGSNAGPFLVDVELVSAPHRLPTVGHILPVESLLELFDLAFAGALQAGAATIVERVPGTTNITGTATSPSGTYTVDVTR